MNYTKDDLWMVTLENTKIAGGGDGALTFPAHMQSWLWESLREYETWVAGNHLFSLGLRLN